MSAFFVLTREAILDAARRRIVAVIAVVSLLSLMMVESCTSCSTGQIMVNGELTRAVDFSGYTGAVTLATLGLWCVVLAGVLAAEHLAQALADGSATLGLARPVGRGAFALARLAGALSIAWVTGAVLLGGTVFFLERQGELPLAPALWAALSVLVSGTIVGAFAMALSLHLPRIATVLLVFAVVGSVALANASSLVRQAQGGVIGAIDRFGPPLLTSLALALQPWVPRLELAADPVDVALRLAVWTALGLVCLLALFRRVELGR